jgi:hypothetical protein
MKTIEQCAEEYAEALADIADVLDLPTGYSSSDVVDAARIKWAKDIHSCHHECQRPACIMRRDMAAMKSALEFIAKSQGLPPHIDRLVNGTLQNLTTP